MCKCPVEPWSALRKRGSCSTANRIVKMPSAALSCGRKSLGCAETQPSNGMENVIIDKIPINAGKMVIGKPSSLACELRAVPS